jgi:hypothetical protein
MVPVAAEQSAGDPGAGDPDHQFMIQAMVEIGIFIGEPAMDLVGH